MGGNAGKLEGQEQAIQQLREDFNRKLSEEKKRSEEAEKQHQHEQLALMSRIDQFENDKRRYDEEINQLKTEIKRLEKKCEDDAALIEQYKKEIDTLVKEKKELESKLRERNKEIKTLKSKIPKTTEVAILPPDKDKKTSDANNGHPATEVQVTLQNEVERIFVKPKHTEETPKSNNDHLTAQQSGSQTHVTNKREGETKSSQNKDQARPRFQYP